MDNSLTNVNIAIQDAGVMVDLSRAGMVQEAFKLPVTYFTAESVFDDLHAKQRAEYAPFIQTTQLRPVSMDAAMFATIAAYQPTNPELSEHDLSVFHLAKANNLPVLASCNTLRLHMQRLGIESNSTYWVLDSLVDTGLITVPYAGVLLEQLATANPRLAPEEYALRKRIWQTGPSESIVDL